MAYIYCTKVMYNTTPGSPTLFKSLLPSTSERHRNKNESLGSDCLSDCELDGWSLEFHWSHVLIWYVEIRELICFNPVLLYLWQLTKWLRTGYCKQDKFADWQRKWFIAAYFPSILFDERKRRVKFSFLNPNYTSGLQMEILRSYTLHTLNG